ncbi:interferon-induced protein 44-like [Hemibagrus wyckioides]|uniref:interferon-induced protein 44-like n=1 Tax=Hemibagrus wyckioides TaxID=337641 RepID=UPI00266C2656|nr:interferon-induced protein 44-like [Hemibagrus wyckioides]XP_058273976.1 interferon-induced protein 44-like [Hemibagrus wyckioides]XP_058273985.1 interferon-induced protein 44-like [Hemibagrus wyckioides]XP_058273990.1 interferon-induced protein 44-like [Hemibagrus wyckioides]
MTSFWKSLFSKQPQPNAKADKDIVVQFDDPWREIKWDSKTEIVEEVKELALSNPDIKHLRFLMTGPVGAGKSSFVNSVNSVFQNRITNKAIMATSTEISCTEIYKGYKIKNGESGTLSFMFFDMMGVEKGSKKGVDVHDLNNALLGHLPDGYKFNQHSCMSTDDTGYISKPSLDGKTHCLVCAVDGNTISQLDAEIVDKIKQSFKAAAKLGISQVIVMTKIDEICPLVKEKLRNVYKSKKIKEKMKECSNILSVPMTCIFPVKNYHEETKTNDDIDVLLLNALKQMIHYANDYTEEL